MNRKHCLFVWRYSIFTIILTCFFTLIVSRLYEEETLFVWLCSILCVQSVRSHSWVIATMRRKVWPTVRHTIISCLETSALSATVSSLAMVSLLTVYLSILLNCNTYVVFHILVSPNIERKNVGICYFHVFIHIKNSWYYNTLCHGDCCQNSKQNSMFWYFFYQNICNPKNAKMLISQKTLSTVKNIN